MEVTKGLVRVTIEHESGNTKNVFVICDECSGDKFCESLGYAAGSAIAAAMVAYRESGSAGQLLIPLLDELGETTDCGPWLSKITRRLKQWWNSDERSDETHWMLAMFANSDSLGVGPN